MNDILDYIAKHDQFAIISHISPDGDTLGSALALFLALQSLGKGVSVHCKSKPTPYYDFLPHIDRFLPLEEIPASVALICVDCADRPRTGLGEEHTQPILSIDHHISNTRFGQVNHLCPDACATAEIIFDVTTALKVRADKEMATLLYIGICTDTNNYTNANVTGRTFEISAALVDAGVEVNWVTKQLYRTRTLAKTKAIAQTIDNIEVFCQGKLAVSHLTHRQLLELGLHDAEGLVDYPNDLMDVCVGIFIKESRPNVCKFSLRSNTDNIDVSQICGAFEGGGHKRAAGCKMELPLEQAKATMIAEVQKWMG